MIDDKPFGALILAIQAVEHALGAWESGIFVEWQGSAAHFSGAKYGDILERATTTNPKAKPVTTLNKRATRYIPTMNNFKESTWEDIFSTITSYLDSQKSKKKKVKAAESNSSMEIIVAEEDHVLISDDE
ncbi:hypothetical protein LshimejAT787_2400380 [Lyophyllum shimeji]|uniref:Uncharacterized protein n=1 Tax=Lyophyllum shimeji TaxID=47721 RepID=A0A9P3UV75_LYOSH|nr:hypothetical protein LshimejAT787_2400380 [Lyophyllum shimeji]